MSKDIKEEILKTALDQNGGYDFNEFIADYTKTYSLILRAMDEYASILVSEATKPLEEEINRLKGEEWISVEDSPPEYYKSVWAEFENGNVAAVWRAVGDDGEDIYTITGTHNISPTPARYLYLPEPPTQ